MIDTGRLDRRILIETLRPDAPTGAGGRIDRTLGSNWRPFDGRGGCRWARRHTPGGREFARAAEQHAETTEVFDVRWDPDTHTIDAEARVTFEGRVHHLVAVFEVTDDGMRNEMIRLVCSHVG
ncbi:MAG: head-tail adaptor protein [Actinomycetota bacterium]